MSQEFEMENEEFACVKTRICETFVGPLGLAHRGCGWGGGQMMRVETAESGSMML